MHLHGLLIALALCVDITAALPADQVPSLEFPLRLIKRAEDDPGQWMTETEIFENLTLKRRGFIDITDITVRPSSYPGYTHSLTTPNTGPRLPTSPLHARRRYYRPRCIISQQSHAQGRGNQDDWPNEHQQSPKVAKAIHKVRTNPQLLSYDPSSY